MNKKIKVLAISHSYLEPFTRIGFVSKNNEEIELVVVVPEYKVKKNFLGYSELLKENFKVIILKNIF